MKQLDKTYRKYGYYFELIERIGNVCIYRQFDCKGGKPIAYEVFKLRKQKSTVLPNGKTLIEREAIPPTSSWGKEAFTVWTLDKAREKAVKLNETVKLSQNSTISNNMDKLISDVKIT